MPSRLAIAASACHAMHASNEIEKYVRLLSYIPGTSRSLRCVSHPLDQAVNKQPARGDEIPAVIWGGVEMAYQSTRLPFALCLFRVAGIYQRNLFLRPSSWRHRISSRRTRSGMWHHRGSPNRTDANDRIYRRLSTSNILSDQSLPAPTMHSSRSHQSSGMKR